MDKATEIRLLMYAKEAISHQLQLMLSGNADSTIIDIDNKCIKEFEYYSNINDLADTERIETTA